MFQLSILQFDETSLDETLCSDSPTESLNELE
jgi:hypothetical protein